ncbi:MAG: glycerol-3-phosphate 1-O-acyltransferase PlsY [Oscillospiraceae bacterium]|nr:glycerol-3-phosphate 1-O-acyltransferase PlsY [Oscillospiraceae bacterium]
MTALYVFLTLLVGYISGSLSFSIIFSKLMGRDIRRHGSGNAGATNMTRVFGWAAGAGTLAFDILKAVAAMLFGRYFLGDMGICLGGIACMVGHCWPLFHKFKGGKGIAVGAAFGIMIDWRVFAAIVLVFFITALLSKKVSLGSLAAAIAIVPATAVFAPRPELLVLAVVGMCLTVYRHRDNIRRLRSRTEPDFRAACPDKKP